MSLDRPVYDNLLLDELRATYAPLLEKIAGEALQRELDGELPFVPVRLLKEAGFGALRVPEEYGGRGATIPDLTQLWIELAAADANLPQALRGHFAFAEDRLWQHARGEDQRDWFDRFAAGEIAGNAWSEVGSTSIDSQQTVLAQDGADYRLSGTKYYTTGSIYAEWADVYARRVRPGEEDDFVIAIVDTHAEGVSVIDDWDGFGQRGTGSGTTSFAGVEVLADNVLPFGERFPFQTALYQLNLLATLCGIGRAALDDAVGEVRNRERNYSHANAARVRDDPQVLARIGEIASAVYVAEAATLRVASALQDVADDGDQRPGRHRPGQRAGRAGVRGRPGRRHRPGAPGDQRSLRHPRRVGDVASQGPGPALAQRPHGVLAQPADPQVAGRGRLAGQRHAPAVRLGDRHHRRTAAGSPSPDRRTAAGERPPCTGPKVEQSITYRGRGVRSDSP